MPRCRLNTVVLLAMSVACLPAVHAQAAWLADAPFGSSLKGDLYVPTTPASSPAVLVALHYCGGNATSVHGWFDAYADQNGFYIIAPSAGKMCFDSSASRSGDREAIVTMVSYVLANKNADRSRVFAAGMSSGGCMTNTLLAIYPDVFAGGSAMPGLPAGAWPAGDSSCTKCGSSPSSVNGEYWGDIARNAFSWSGTYPCSQQWVGGADEYNFHAWLPAVAAQFQNLGNLSDGSVAAGRSGWTRTVYKDTSGNVRLEANLGPATQKHDLTTVSPALYGDVIAFLGLDKPSGSCGITGTGGTSGTGGIAGTGGIIGTGGTVSSGGVTSSGGVVASGGVVGTGGLTSSGGVTGSGGFVSTGGVQAGGTVGTGGLLISGGATGSGGPGSTGGTSGFGGGAGSGVLVGTGGRLGIGGGGIGTGGLPASGGRASVGGSLGAGGISGADASIGSGGTTDAGTSLNSGGVTGSGSSGSVFDVPSADGVLGIDAAADIGVGTGGLLNIDGSRTFEGGASTGAVLGIDGASVADIPSYGGGPSDESDAAGSIGDTRSAEREGLYSLSCSFGGRDRPPLCVLVLMALFLLHRAGRRSALYKRT